MEAAPPKRQAGGQPGVPLPLSAATRRRLLADMLERAQRGDNGAAEALVRLSLERQAERLTQRAELQHG